MRTSKIFTNPELKAMDDRLKGIKKDPTGRFHGRVKPKIIEMLEHWFHRKKELEKLVEGKK